MFTQGGRSIVVLQSTNQREPLSVFRYVGDCTHLPDVPKSVSTNSTGTLL